MAPSTANEEHVDQNPAVDSTSSPAATLPSTKTLDGSCLCRSITVSLTTAEPLFSGPNGHVCHCKNCRKQAGSPSGVHILMTPTSSVTVSDPQKRLKVYNDSDTQSGRTVPRSFCSECGTPIGAVPTNPDERLSILALGLFEQSPEPLFECFTADRPAWVKPMADGKRQLEYAEGIMDYVPAL